MAAQDEPGLEQNFLKIHSILKCHATIQGAYDRMDSTGEKKLMCRALIDAAIALSFGIFTDGIVRALLSKLKKKWTELGPEDRAHDYDQENFKKRMKAVVRNSKTGRSPSDLLQKPWEQLFDEENTNTFRRGIFEEFSNATAKPIKNFHLKHELTLPSIAPSDRLALRLMYHLRNDIVHQDVASSKVPLGKYGCCLVNDAVQMTSEWDGSPTTVTLAQVETSHTSPTFRIPSGPEGLVVILVRNRQPPSERYDMQVLANGGSVKALLGTMTRILTALKVEGD